MRTQDDGAAALTLEQTQHVLKMIAESETPPQVDKAFKLESLPSLLNRYMGEKGLMTDVLFERIGASRSFGYRVMNGQRRPERDMSLCLALELELPYEEAQNMLKVVRHAPLTPRDSRDLLILHCIMHRKSLGEANDLLEESGLSPLTGK